MGNVMKIPARPQVGSRTAKKEIKKLRVAAYCRVSTDTEEQATSYDAQIQHYREYIISKSEWELVDIYVHSGFLAKETSKKQRNCTPILCRRQSPCYNQQGNIYAGAGRNCKAWNAERLTWTQKMF